MMGTLKKTLELANSVNKKLDKSKKARMQRAKEQGFDTDTVYYHGTQDADIDSFDLDKSGKTNPSARGTGVWLTKDPELAKTYAGGYGSKGAIYPVYVRKGDSAEVDFEGSNWSDLSEDAPFYANSRNAADEDLLDELGLGGEGIDKGERVRLSPGDLGLWDTNGIAIEAQDRLHDSLIMRNVADAGVAENYQETVSFLAQKYPDILKYDPSSKEYFDIIDKIPSDEWDLAREAAVNKAMTPRDNLAVFDPSNIRSVNAAFDPAKKDGSNLLASTMAGTAVGAGALGASDDSEAGVGKLAMDTASRLKRAKEQGFDTDTTYYHGTNADFDAFDLNADVVTDQDRQIKGISITDSPFIANDYAENAAYTSGGARIIPMLANKGRVANFNNLDDFRDIDRESLISQGYDSADYVNQWGEVLETSILDPSNIRSTNAAFDPDKKDSSNLLASIGAGTVAGGAALSSEEAEASFIGQAAKTFSKEALDLAKKMTDEGASRDEIWQATGAMGSPTFKDVDGRWKQEISDQGFKEKPLYSDTDESYTTSNDPDRWFDWRDEAAERGGIGIQKGYELGDLAEAYPQLRGTKVLPNENDAFRGSYDNDRTITVASPEALMGLDEADYKRFKDEQIGRSIPLHELQHAIQEREGFAKGGNPEEFGRSLDERVKEFSVEIEPKIKRLESIPEKDLSGEERIELSRLQIYRDKLLAEITESDGGLKNTPYDKYKRLAGEAEARNVQARLDYDMDKRVENPPWNTLDVPEDELIVRGNTGGVSQSAEGNSFVDKRMSRKGKRKDIDVMKDTAKEPDFISKMLAVNEVGSNLAANMALDLAGSSLSGWKKILTGDSDAEVSMPAYPGAISSDLGKEYARNVGEFLQPAAETVGRFSNEWSDEGAEYSPAIGATRKTLFEAPLVGDALTIGGGLYQAAKENYGSVTDEVRALRAENERLKNSFNQ